MAEKIYYCEGCGGVMEFDIASQKLKCPNCGNSQKIKNEKSKIQEHKFSRKAAQSFGVTEKTSQTMECKGCGAKVEIDADCTATECPYCGSKYVLADKQVESIVPDGVVTFKIDKHEVGDVFAKWIKKKWLAPGDLKNLYQRDKLQGVYLPYWTFDADTVCEYHAEGGKHRKVEEKDPDGNKVEKTVTDWYPVSGKVKEEFDDVLVKASKNLKPSLLEAIEPYNTKELVSYDPTYFSGYGAECYTVSLEDAHREARDKMENELRSKSNKEVLRKYDEVRNLSVDIDYDDETYKHIMIPVYATAYNYKGNTYPVLINGQTGKICGNYPKCKAKIAIIIAIIAAAIAAFVFLSGSKKDSKKDKAADNNTITQEAYMELSDDIVIDDYVLDI